ncbi:hypothetical protein COR50_03230 [Chitinophaga caeni]|uniref:Alpha-galactosidase NEW3 domain-containing protein n=1 Tax=Chitinophaga caeni TaxID=2029983 RepID=A0A291QQR8_9BACT|nr:NEW3 domain-containing protein [Chitinophaga caeni]ATL46261.1 hypothetical protein COR50_03230 [Chitinophaga caeni]
MLIKFYYPRLKFIAFLCLSLSVTFAFTAHAQQKAAKEPSSFTARLMNIESATKDPFRYNANLHNGSDQSNVYNLYAGIPPGWYATFRTQGAQVAALKVDAGKSADISVEITAAPQTKPGKYNIPVTAISNKDTLKLQLEAVVKGSYALELTTPSGRLSDDITEGSSKQIQLTLKNTGTLPLENLQLSSQNPAKWSATFEPSKVDHLEPGQSQDVMAKLNVPDKTIAGDYVTNFTARNDYTNSTATFRMTVKTSLLSGWIGILVILVALGIVYYLVRKYGRR